MITRSHLTPRLTVFTSSVYPDIVRIWNDCIRSSLPAEEICVEVFFDSSSDRLNDSMLPGATILRRNRRCRDFHDAYNEALARAATPYLAFVDTDVFWLSSAVWPRALKELELNEVAAVSCVSRTNREIPGTFAVIMKTDVYRRILAEVPGGFYPALEGIAPGIAPEQWKRFDTGDRAARAVVEAGYEIRLLNLDQQGAFARFHGLTLTRRALEWIGPENFLKVAGDSSYHWTGLAGNAILKKLHDRIYPDAGSFDFPFSPSYAWRTALGHGRTTIRRLKMLGQLAHASRRIERRVRTRDFP